MKSNARSAGTGYVVDGVVTNNGAGNGYFGRSYLDLNRESTNWQKWLSAILIGLLFILIASPFAFGVTGGLFTSLGTGPLTRGGGPTWLGLIIHGIVFTLIARLLMGW